MTHDDLNRWAGEMQDTPLFGALGRFHNEVLPRDRPVDPVKTAEGGPFNTADVTTGGANGYFIRMFMTQYFISRDKGRTMEQAIGDGYDAAKKSYDGAVGNPQ